MIALVDRDSTIRTRPVRCRGQFARVESHARDQLFATRYSLFASRQAAYDAANQQIQFNAASPNQTFDANGNLTSETGPTGTTSYTWDARNRLVAQTGPGVNATFQYDALGRRVSKTINGETKQFLYDGNDIVQEIGGGAVGASYVRSLNIDEPFVRQMASGNEFYHADALGSTLDLTNYAGAVQASYNYEAFGKTTLTGTSSNPFQYTGRENDGGLYYQRARYYIPSLQRFIGEDFVRHPADNLYAYVLNSPLRYLDPFGLERIEVFTPSTGTFTADSSQTQGLIPNSVDNSGPMTAADRQALIEGAGMVVAGAGIVVAGAVTGVVGLPAVAGAGGEAIAGGSLVDIFILPMALPVIDTLKIAAIAGANIVGGSAAIVHGINQIATPSAGGGSSARGGSNAVGGPNSTKGKSGSKPGGRK